MKSGRAWLGTIMYRVNQAPDRMDMSYVKLLYIDETSFKRSHSYITLICDQDRRIIFVCEGKSSKTMDRLTLWLKAHDERRENIRFVSRNFGEAYPSGVRRNYPNVRIVYDEFHAVDYYRGHGQHSSPGRGDPGHQGPH